MKKILLLVATALLSVAVVAQPRAIGGRVSGGIEASYQHYLGSNFAEIDLGYNISSGFGITAIYDFICATPEWTPKGTWEVYAGPGLSLGTYFAAVPFQFAVCGQVGLSYTFWFPLQLSVDFRPAVGMGLHKGNAYFNLDGMLGFVPTIGVRYSFGN